MIDAFGWRMKNPFLSMWLSAANRIAGTTRSAVSAEVRRQSTAAIRKATGTGLATKASPPKKSKVARKRKAGR
jgi:hypothetical protein